MWPLYQGLCEGTKRAMGDCVGEMGWDRVPPASDVTLEFSIFHHRLETWFPVDVLPTSFVPCGLVSCPNHRRPCFLSEFFADVYAWGESSVWSEVSLILLPKVVREPCESEIVASCLLRSIPIRAHQ